MKENTPQIRATEIIRIKPVTRDKIRYGAALLGITMAEMTEIAVVSYIHEHNDELDQRTQKIIGK